LSSMLLRFKQQSVPRIFMVIPPTSITVQGRAAFRTASQAIICLPDSSLPSILFCYGAAPLSNPLSLSHVRRSGVQSISGPDSVKMNAR
jgi:hypothetical protein